VRTFRLRKGRSASVCTLKPSGNSVSSPISEIPCRLSARKNWRARYAGSSRCFAHVRRSSRPRALKGGCNKGWCFPFTPTRKFEPLVASDHV